MALVMEKTPTVNRDLTNFCVHYVLEDRLVPEDEHRCEFCETTWIQRLEDNMEQHVEAYTTNFPCLAEGGHVVPYCYARCPHCKGTKGEHLVQLIRRLVSSLVESNVPEVGPKEQETLEFDPMLFVAATAVGYPELYQSTLKDWSDLCPNRDLSGEVFNFITPIFSVHRNEVCTIECSNRSLADLNQLVAAAYDRDVEGEKTRPKVHVSITKTQRVKKHLKNAKKENTSVVPAAG